MAVDQRRKDRWCGYCGKEINGRLEDFLKHMDYCELALVNKMKGKKKDGGTTTSGS